MPVGIKELRGMIKRLNEVSNRKYTLEGAYGKYTLDSDTNEHIVAPTTKSELYYAVYGIVKYKEHEGQTVIIGGKRFKT